MSSNQNTTLNRVNDCVTNTWWRTVLLRVWENRYSAFKPIRTETGRRMYSENDVLRARALLALTQKGFRVGEIAKLSLPELDKLLSPDKTDKSIKSLDPTVKK